MSADETGRTEPVIPDALHAQPLTPAEQRDWCRLISRAMTVEASRLYARLRLLYELEGSD